MGPRVHVPELVGDGNLKYSAVNKPPYELPALGKNIAEVQNPFLDVETDGSLKYSFANGPYKEQREEADHEEEVDTPIDAKCGPILPPVGGKGKEDGEETQSNNIDDLAEKVSVVGGQNDPEEDGAGDVECQSSRITLCVAGGTFGVM